MFIMRNGRKEINRRDNNKKSVTFKTTTSKSKDKMKIHESSDNEECSSSSEEDHEDLTPFVQCFSRFLKKKNGYD